MEKQKIRSRQLKPRKKYFCIQCGDELKGKEVKKTYPFGRKSRPIKSGICRRCKFKTKSNRNKNGI